METIKRALVVYVAFAFIFVVLGICFIAWPQTSLRIVCYAFGAAVLILGIIRLSQFMKNKENNKTIRFQFNLVLGVLFIIGGGLLLIFPNIIMPVFPVVIGIAITADGIHKIKVSFDAKAMGLNKWGLILLFALLTIVFGVSLMLNSANITTVIILLLGVSLLIDGIQNIVTIITTFKLMSTLVLKEDAANAEFKDEDIPTAPDTDVKTESIRPEDMIIEDKEDKEDN